MLPIKRKHGIILLDDEDFWVTQDYSLTVQVKNRGYLAVKVRPLSHRKDNEPQFTSLGRVLLGLRDRDLQVDHINNNGLDNRRDNLRVVDKDLQSANRRGSGRWPYKGIHYRDRKSLVPFRGRIKRRGKTFSGPYRASAEKAALDYNRMAIALWGHQIVINDDVRCVDMHPRPAEAPCLFCHAVCHCCCVCSDTPSAGMQRLFDTLDAS